MSSYVSFFVKNRGELVELCTFGHSYELCSAFSEIPYGNVRKMTSDDFDTAERNLMSLRDTYKSQLTYNERAREELRQLKDLDVDERLGRINETYFEDEETNGEIEQLTYAIGALGLLRDIADNAREGLYFGEEVPSIKNS